MTYKLKFINSFRFMLTSLSSLVNDLSEIYSKKCKDKNCKSKSNFIGLKIMNYITNVTIVKKYNQNQ